MRGELPPKLQQTLEAVANPPHSTTEQYSASSHRAGAAGVVIDWFLKFCIFAQELVNIDSRIRCGMRQPRDQDGEHVKRLDDHRPLIAAALVL